MEFSVIIPLYNKHSTIRLTVESVLNQSFPYFELIIIDDGSADGSADKVRQLPDSRISLVTQPNAGVSAARNAGMRLAKNDLVAFLDADDYWDPRYLEEMAGLIQQFPEAGIYGCAFNKISGTSSTVDDFHLPGGYNGLIINYFQHAVHYHLFCSSAVIIRKSVVDKAGYFDERISIGEDHDYWFRIAYHYKAAFLNKVLAHYDIGAEKRAMNKIHSYPESLLCYTSKYTQMEQLNADFKYFINYYRITMIPKLLLRFNPGKKEIKEYMNLIEPAGQAMRYRIFLKLPVWLQKIVSSIYLKYRGLEA